MLNAIYFDMDGTIADLYGVEGWLEDLRNEVTVPYENAKPMLNMSLLARRLNALRKQGFTIGIISWNSKGATKAYEDAVAKAKLDWLKKHLPSVQFDEIHIVKYGTPKTSVTPLVQTAVLFDDDYGNAYEWMEKGGYSCHPDDIENILKKLLGTP